MNSRNEMKGTFYETLQVSEAATQAEIKKAYRKLVLQHHPDRNSAANAKDKFIEVATAYEVLSDPERRREYDRLRRFNEAQKASKVQDGKPGVKKSSPPKPESAKFDLRKSEELLCRWLGMHNWKEAEPLARKILEREPRSAVSYAVLGEIARARGDWQLASKMFAYAAQFDPRNETYLRKHEELMEMAQRSAMTQHFQDNKDGRWVAPIVGTVISVIAACFVALSPEQPLFAKDTIVSTWTVGVMSMLFFSGAVMGATLALSDFLDRFEMITPMGRLSPNFLLLALAVANLWVAGAIYLISGSLLRSFSITHSRLLLSMVGIVVILTLGAAGSQHVDPYQVLLWGGSLVAAGSTLGWAFADGLKD